MPKIEFVRNKDNEIVFPKTHENAILTDDGYSIEQKFDFIKQSLGNKADTDHKHNFSDLTNIPSSFKADGGNADSVGNCTIDDTMISINKLWTSKKINNELSKLKKLCEKSDIYIGVSEPDDAKIWINPEVGILRYKVKDLWVVFNGQLTFKLD